MGLPILLSTRLYESCHKSAFTRVHPCPILFFAPFAPLRELRTIRVYPRSSASQPSYVFALRPTPYTLRLLPPLCSLPPDPRPLLPGPCFSLAAPPLLLYHSATHTNAPSVPLSRADDASHGPWGAVSMSAHSNHTSTPFFLTAQDCSLPPMEKGGAGRFADRWNTPGRSGFSKGRWDWKAQLLDSLRSTSWPRGREGDYDLYPCLEWGVGE
jgi:hypothetical protein